TKTNNTSDVRAVGVPFNWTLTVANTGLLGATFTDGQTLLSDPLPAGATYGTPTPGSFTGITNGGSISCSIDGGNILTCTASGADVTIGATTGSFVVTIPVTPTAGGNLVNTATVDPNNNITEIREDNNTGSNTVTVLAAPTIAKAFSPATIQSGDTSTITFTLTNPNAGELTGATFTDTLSNMSISGAQNAGGTCTGADGNSFANGDTALTLSGLTIPASGSCTVTIVVTSSTAGVHPNTTSGVSSTETPTAGAVSNIANLTVSTLVAPTVAKSFVAANLASGGNTNLTVTIGNTNLVAITLTADLVDTFPAGMTINTAGNTGSCTGVTATAGASSFTMAGGTSIPAGGCTVIVNVTSSTAGVATNTI
ncbi:MAG: hypothetical protein Q8O57_09535, partial [Kiritimatiellota bacterium]|nr:hypothetical protein [Kiritimatiellota bacterium]